MMDPGSPISPTSKSSTLVDLHLSRTDVIRAVPAGVVMSGFGHLWRNNKGSAATYDLSSAASLES